jgi:hypothetical protein
LWQVGASYAQFWSHLHFDGGIEPTLRQHTVVGSVGYYFSNGWSAVLSGGAILGGEMYGDGQSLDLNPGWLVSLSCAKRWIDEDGWIPFFSTGIAVSVSGSHLSEPGQDKERLFGTDVRLSLVVGYTFFDFWRVYLAPRAFGGPIFWFKDGQRLQGRDRYFFEAGMGMSFLLPAGITIFIDGSPAGEQAVSAGLAVAF